MQREILDDNESADIRVYAVWLPFLGATKEATSVSRRVLPDPRAIHYWDGAAATSRWFAENVDDLDAADAWDIYFLYGPDAEWTDVPGPPAATGRTIIGRSAELKDAITPMLQDASTAP